ncbi:MAG: hypothetical protein HY900_00435 [Deltaproteobacteria bacterium]|nr:hypothetical protein [Deltaproteobacteria bacterium]
MKIRSARMMGTLVCAAFLGLLSSMLVASPALAVTCASIATGDWGTGGTWDCNHAPIGSDSVIVVSPHTVTLSSGTQTRTAATQVNEGATLVISGTGQINLNAGGATLNVKGTLDSKVADAVTAGTFRFPVTWPGSVVRFDIGGTVNSNIVWIVDSQSTFEYYGAGAQAVPLLNQPYANLILSGSGIKTLPSGVVITGDLWVKGTASYDVFGGGSITNPPPASIALSSMNVNGPTLSWLAPSGATNTVLNYIVYRSTDGFTWGDPIATLNSATLSYVFSAGEGTLSNTNYYWTVTALYNDILNPPESAKIVKEGRTALAIGWNTIGCPYDGCSYSSLGRNLWGWTSGGQSLAGTWAVIASPTTGTGQMSNLKLNTTVLNGSGSTVSSATVTLLPGWNLISNPTLTNMTGIDAEWSVYLATDIPGNAVPLSTAVGNGTILNGLYWYNPTAAGYTSWQITSATLVEPWKGYWVYLNNASSYKLIIQ